MRQSWYLEVSVQFDFQWCHRTIQTPKSLLNLALASNFLRHFLSSSFVRFNEIQIEQNLTYFLVTSYSWVILVNLALANGLESFPSWVCGVFLFHSQSKFPKDCPVLQSFFRLVWNADLIGMKTWLEFQLEFMKWGWGSEVWSLFSKIFQKYQIFALPNRNTSGLNKSLGNYNVILRFGGKTKPKKSLVFNLIKKYTFWNSLFAKISVIFLCFRRFIFPIFPKISKKWHQTQIFSNAKKSFRLEFRLEYSISSSECRALTKWKLNSLGGPCNLVYSITLPAFCGLIYLTY